MLKQRSLVRFLNSESKDLDAPNGRAFFDRVQRFSNDELWNFLQIGIAASEQAEQPHKGETARRYGSAGLYVIAGGCR